MFDFPNVIVSRESREVKEKIAAWYTMLLKKGADPSLCNYIFKEESDSVFVCVLREHEHVCHFTHLLAANL
jgi:hypothetical protein